MAAGAKLTLIDGKIEIINISDDDSEYEFTVGNDGGLESGGTPVEGPKLKVKSSDQSLVSSTTMQNDNTLFFDIGTAETWFFDILVFASEAGTNPNIKFMLAASAGLTGSIEYSYNAIGSTAALTLSDFTTESNSVGLTSLKKPISLKGSVTSIVAGRLTLQWAQGTSDTDATIVHAKSSLMAIKVG